MQRVYVSDWLPPRRKIADLSTVPTGPSLVRPGVGFTPVTVSRSPRRPLANAKPRVPDLVLPRVVQGPLAQRVEPSKRALKGSAPGARGVSGGGGYGIYWTEFKRQKDGLAAAITQTQKQLDKIDSAQIGTDSQLRSLRDSAGPQAPQDVLSAVDTASEARRALSDMADELRNTIDSLNDATQKVSDAEQSGQAGPFSPGQQLLEASFKKAQALANQVQAVQRSASNTASRVEAATQVVNRYVDQINAQAQIVTDKQAQDTTAANIAYSLADQQRQIEQQKADRQAQAEKEASDRAAALEQVKLEAQAKLDAALQDQQKRYQEMLQAAREQQQAYQPPSYPQFQPTRDRDPYAGGATFEKGYRPLTQTQDPSFPTPQPQYVVQEDTPVQTYQTPPSGYEEEGPGEAGSQWGGQVDGVGDWNGGVGATSSAAALAQQTAREVLAKSNLKLAQARKELELQRVSDEQAKRQAEKPQSSPSGSFWTTGRKIAAGVFGGILAGLGAYAALGGKK